MWSVLPGLGKSKSNFVKIKVLQSYIIFVSCRFKIKYQCNSFENNITKIYLVLLKLWQSFLYNDVKKTLMSSKEREVRPEIRTTQTPRHGFGAAKEIYFMKWHFPKVLIAILFYHKPNGWMQVFSFMHLTAFLSAFELLICHFNCLNC